MLAESKECIGNRKQWVVGLCRGRGWRSQAEGMKEVEAGVCGCESQKMGKGGRRHLVKGKC